MDWRVWLSRWIRFLRWLAGWCEEVGFGPAEVAGASPYVDAAGPESVRTVIDDEHVRRVLQERARQRAVEAERFFQRELGGVGNV